MATPSRPISRFPTFDTPTPAPSSSHSNSQMSNLFQQKFTSLKPTRSFSNINKPAAAPAALGTSKGRPLNIPQPQDTSHLDLNSINLDDLEIKTDGTEQQRLRLEEEIRLGMAELENNNSARRFGQQSQQRHERSWEAESAGLGGASDLEDLDMEQEGRRWREQLEEEESASEQERERERPQSLSERSHDDDEEEDLTYLSISRSVSISPTSPRKFPSVPVAAPSIPKPSQQQQQQQAAPLRNIFSQPSPAPIRRPFDFISNLKKQQTSSPLGGGAFVRSNSAPPIAAPNTSGVSNGRMRLPDVTGLTEGLTSPMRGRGHYSAPPAGVKGKKSEEANVLASALAQLRTRLFELEQENEGAEEKVRVLEERLGPGGMRREQEERTGRERTDEGWRDMLKAEERKREELEALVHRLRTHVTHLSHSLSSYKSSLPTQNQSQPSPALALEIKSITSSLNELGEQVESIKSVVDELVREKGWRKEEEERLDGMNVRREGEGLQRKKGEAEGKRTWRWMGPETPAKGQCFVRPEEISRLQEEIQQEYSRRSPSARTAFSVVVDEDEHGYVSAGSATPRPKRTHFAQRPSTAPLPTKTKSAPPKPQQPRHHYQDSESDDDSASDDADLTAKFARAEELFQSVSAPRHTTPKLCSVCKRRKVGVESAPPKMMGAAPAPAPAKKGVVERDFDGDDEYEEIVVGRKSKAPEKKEKEKRKEKVDHQKTLENVLRDLEDDFLLHKKIYIELSEQYKVMGAKLGGGKRRLLAEHLKESIDTLEIKADRVRRLDDLLHFQQ